MANFEIRKINDYISYIPATEVPLSSDVGIIYGEKATYLFDVGSTLEILDFLHSLQGDFDIICSHFHGDHTWWLTEHKAGEKGVLEGDTVSINYEKPRYRHLYVSKETQKHTKAGELVTQPLVIYDKIKADPEGRDLKIEIIPCPTSHCKGALIAVVNDEYIFAGDSTYSKGVPAGEVMITHEYNVQQMKAQLELLESLKADKILLSHDKKFLRPKKVAIREMQVIYSKRVPGENTIKL